MLLDHVAYSRVPSYNGLFSKLDVQLKTTTNRNSFQSYLSQELFKSRVETRTLEAEFATFAEYAGASLGLVHSLWNEINSLGIETFLPKMKNAEFEIALRNLLVARRYDEQYVVAALELAKKFRTYFSERVRQIFPNGANASELRLGGLGELLAYLIATDLEQHDCIYHKLTPDTPNAARHGVDLLTIRFGPSSDNDEVHWWEAKGTKVSFSSQRDSIVYWFNEQMNSRLSTTVEAAKKEWVQKYDRPKWERAAKALNMYLLKVCRYKYVGTIAFDSSIIPSGGAIEGFSRVNGPPESKQLVLFPLANIEKLAEEVYTGAWSI
jgi:hypothetical protein